MLKPTGLVRGHYECRSFDESLPILKEFLALEVVDERDGQKLFNIRIPAGSWSCMRTAPTRRSNPCVITTVCAWRRTPKSIARRNIWKAKRIGSASKPSNRAKTTMPIRFTSTNPGGNYWEIESYEHAVEHGMGKTTNPHWSKPLTEKLSRQRVRAPGAHPWDVGERRSRNLRAVLPRSPRTRGRETLAEFLLRQTSRHTVVHCLHQSAEPQAPAAVALPTLYDGVRFTVRCSCAHREFTANRDNWKLRALEAGLRFDRCASFQFADLNGNWWEIERKHLAST